MRVLDCGSAGGLLDCFGQPPGDALFAYGDRVWGDRMALCGVELDQPADRLGACPCERELRREPVGGDGSIGVGACDQSLLPVDL